MGDQRSDITVPRDQGSGEKSLVQNVVGIDDR